MKASSKKTINAEWYQVGRIPRGSHANYTLKISLWMFLILESEIYILYCMSWEMTWPDLSLRKGRLWLFRGWIEKNSLKKRIQITWMSKQWDPMLAQGAQKKSKWYANFTQVIMSLVLSALWSCQEGPEIATSSELVPITIDSFSYLSFSMCIMTWIHIYEVLRGSK